MTKKVAHKKGDGGKKPRLKRAPNAPKRFKSAYMCFSTARHKEIRNASDDKKILASEVAKQVSKEWKSMSNEEKNVWEEKASEDRDRYYREKATYKGPWKIPKDKDPDAPKKPMSAFLAYSNERRKTIADANPGLGNAEISRVLAKLWRECPDEIKNRYRKREAEDRAKFKEALAEWEQSRYIASENSSEVDDSDSKEELSQALNPQVAQQAPLSASAQPETFPLPLNGQQAALAQYHMLQANGVMGQQASPLDASQVSLFASRSSADNVSMHVHPSLHQQFLALQPAALPTASTFPLVQAGQNMTGGPTLPMANAPFALDPSPVVSTGHTGAIDPQRGFMNQAQSMLYTQSHPQTLTANAFRPIQNPFTETDPGGFLAAFAALEERVGSDSKTDDHDLGQSGGND